MVSLKDEDLNRYINLKRGKENIRVVTISIKNQYNFLTIITNIQRVGGPSSAWGG